MLGARAALSSSRRCTRRAFSAAPPAPPPPPSTTTPVPLLPGEVLLATSGNHSGSAATRSWMFSVGPCAYVSVVKGIDVVQGLNDGLPLLSPGWTALMCGAALFSSVVCYGTMRAMVRAVVLAADGQSLRIHPFSLVPFNLQGLGAPVTVPIRLLRENSDVHGKREGAEANIFVKVRHGGTRGGAGGGGGGGALSATDFCVEKPPKWELALPPVRGSGLAFTERGLAPSSVPADLGASAARALPMARSDHEAFRRYAVLAWVLNGNPVMDMARLRSGDWQLESMATQLGTADRATLQDIGLGRWRDAVDKRTGRAYFYDVESWEVAWEPPPGWRERRARLEREQLALQQQQQQQAEGAAVLA